MNANEDDDSRMGKIANGVTLTIISKYSSIVVLALFSIVTWLGAQWMNGLTDSITDIKNQLEQLDIRNSKQDSEIQDHESRLVFGKQQREAFQSDAIKQFERLNLRLETIGERLADLNGNIISLKTTITERVPPNPPSRNQP